MTDRTCSKCNVCWHTEKSVDKWRCMHPKVKDYAYQPQKNTVDVNEVTGDPLTPIERCRKMCQGRFYQWLIKMHKDVG